MKEVPQKLLSWLNPGNIIWLHYSDGNSNNKRMHIRAVVDDDYIVYRVWSKRNNDWAYHVEWVYNFAHWYLDGHIHLEKEADTGFRCPHCHDTEVQQWQDDDGWWEGCATCDGPGSRWPLNWYEVNEDE